MKTRIMLSVIVLAIASAAFGQAKTSNESKLEAKIIALERQAWQAWKDRNVAYLRANTTETFLSISSEGVSDKAQVLKAASCLHTPVDILDRARRTVLRASQMNVPKANAEQ